MDIKAILSEPDQAIKSKWGSIESCDCSEHIFSLAEAIKLTLSEIKSLKKKKQLCAKAFKTAAGDIATIESLKAQMQTITLELNDLTEQRKKKEQELIALLTPATNETESTSTSTSTSTPDQFRIVTADNCRATDIKSLSILEQGLSEATRWDAYVSSQPNASLYHYYHWRSVIEKSFNHNCHYFAAITPDGNIVGILPVSRLTSMLFGDFAVSLPYFNYGGVLANTTYIANLLLEHAANFFNDLGVKHLEVRTNREKLCAWPATTDKVSMIRPLPNNTEELSRELGSKIRAQIKRAKREQPEVLIGGLELLDEFYRVFCINMRDLGTPVYGKSFFTNILKQWPNVASIVIIRLKNRPVATAILLSQGEMLEIPWASTLKQVNPMSINMLLYWEVLSFAITSGHKFFDFGRSTKNSGTYQFKKQWGATPVQHHWYYWLNEGVTAPNLKPDNPKFSFAIRVWKLLPVKVANIIGPLLVKNLP